MSMLEIRNNMQPTKTLEDNTWETYRALVPKGADPQPEDEEAMDIRTDIIIAYVYLCKRVVAKMRKSMPSHVDPDDLESWAKIGLLQAVTRYDHTMQVPFEAFATQRVRSVIMDGVRDADWAPRSLRKKHRDITKVEDKFRQEKGRDATPEEVAAVIVTDKFNKDGVEPSEKEFEEAVMEAMADISSTKYRSDISAHTYIEGNPEAQNKPASLNDEEDELVTVLKSVVAKALQSMEIRKAAIIAMHYYGEKKLALVAQELNMSEAKVGELHAAAVMEIWEQLANVISEE